MDTTQPPLECAGCEKPIWPGDPMVWRTGTNEKGELVDSLMYHSDCAPPDQAEAEPEQA